MFYQDTLEPIEIRVHHLASAKGILSHSREKAIELLVGTGYMRDKKDSFIEIYDFLKQKLDNPEQRFKLVAEQPDFICRACIDNGAKPRDISCFSSKEQRRILIKKMVGGFFADSIIEEGKTNSDEDLARYYSLEVGGIYTSRDLREKFEF